MPSAKKDASRNRSVKEFFKPFTIPKNRIPINDVLEDEIVVAAPKQDTPNNSLELGNALNSSPIWDKVERRPKSSQRSPALLNLASTPTSSETTPKDTPKPPLVAIGSDGADDNDPIFSSPSLPQRQVMTVVERPSPRSKPNTEPEEARPQPATASFSSFSTLSSAPISTSSSSRRIIKDGIQAITNSDSGSAESSSEDELADVSTFMPRKRLKLTPSPPLGEDKNHPFEILSTIKPSTRQSLRLSEESKQSRSISVPKRAVSPPRKKPSYVHGLMNLVKQQENDQKAHERMKAMEETFAHVERKREQDRMQERNVMSGLKAAVADDSDEGERMLLAVQRTGALEGEEKLYFFAGVSETCIDDPFPSNAAVNDKRLWVQRLGDERWRIQACLSGFVAELAHRDGMPHRIHEWMARQLMHEERSDLREAYTVILQVCRNERSTAHKGQFTFASTNTLRDWYVLQDRSVKQATPGPPHGLEYVLQAIRGLSDGRCDHHIATLLGDLIFANIDANVVANASLGCAIDDCVEDLLHQIGESHLIDVYDSIVSSFVLSDWSMQLKCRAVASLPANSDRSHILRRRLALRIIVGDQACDSPRDPTHAQAVLTRLKRMPELAVSESTDYDLLGPLVQVLDIAIDSGFDATSSTLQPTKKPFSTLTPSESAKAFDAQIDGFIAQFSLMSSRIKDAGTTHLHRSQTKSVIERLTKRLEYGVRSKPRPRKGIFSNGAALEEEQRGFLKDFLKMADKGPNVVVRIEGENGLVGVEEN